MYVKKDYVWNPAKRGCKNGRYLASIMDSAFICDNVIDADANSNDKTNLNEKKVTCTMQNFDIFVSFL